MTSSSPIIINDKGEVIIYQNPNGSIEVNFKNGQIWLNQNQIATIFAVNQPAISKHVKNIIQSQELISDQVHSILEYTTNDGKFHSTSFYNLDMILSIGYIVNSKLATKFRQWVNRGLKDYIIKGVAYNPDRLEEIKSKLSFLINNKNLLSNSSFEFLLDRYTHSLATLNRFDENRLPEILDENNFEIELKECLQIIQKTKTILIAQSNPNDKDNLIKLIQIIIN